MVVHRILDCRPHLDKARRALGQGVRHTSLNITALVLGLFGVAAIVGLLTGFWRAGLALVPMIPGSLACLNETFKKEPQLIPADTKLTLRMFRPAAVVFGIFFSMIALLNGISALANALGADLFATILVYVPFAIVAVIFAGLIAGFVARTVVRARGYDSNGGVAFFMPIDKWKKLDEEQARLRWSKAFSLPLGGTLTQAWDDPDGNMTRIQCRDATGEAYRLIDGPPTLLGATTQWVAGLFIRAESDEPGGRRRRSVRLFERLDCRWQPRTEEESADDLARLGGERPPGHLGSWQCADCGVIRLDFQSGDGRVLQVFRNLPEEPEPAYIAGVFFMHGRTLYPRSAMWSQPDPSQPTASSSSPPTTQPS